MRTPTLLLFSHAYMHYCHAIAIIDLGVRIEDHLNGNAYYSWADNKRFGVRIEDRKFFNV